MYEFTFTSGTEKQIAYANALISKAQADDGYLGEGYQGLVAFLDGSMVEEFFAEHPETPASIKTECERLAKVVGKALEDAGAFLDLATEHYLYWQARIGLERVGDGETVEDVIAWARQVGEDNPMYRAHRLHQKMIEAYEELYGA